MHLAFPPFPGSETHPTRWASPRREHDAGHTVRTGSLPPSESEMLDDTCKSRTVRAGMGMVLALGWAWLAVTPALASGPGAIAWRQDLRAASAEAEAQGLPLWIQFTGPWCYYCQRMDRESFTHPRIVARSRDAFIPILLQADAHEDLALRYELSGLPATVVVRPSGEVLGKHEGFADAVTFDTFLGSTLARLGPSPSAGPIPFAGLDFDHGRGRSAGRRVADARRRRGPGGLLPRQPGDRPSAGPRSGRVDPHPRRCFVPLRHRRGVRRLPEVARAVHPRQRRSLPGDPGGPERVAAPATLTGGSSSTGGSTSAPTRPCASSS